MTTRIENTARYSADVTVRRLDDYVDHLNGNQMPGAIVLGQCVVTDLDLTGLSMKVDHFVTNTTDFEVERFERDSDVKSDECCGMCQPAKETPGLGALKKRGEELVAALAETPFGHLFTGVSETTQRDVHVEKMHKTGYEQGGKDRQDLILTFMESLYNNLTNPVRRSMVAEIIHHYDPARWLRIASQRATTPDTFGENKSRVRTDAERREEVAQGLRDELKRRGVDGTVEIIEDENIPEGYGVIDSRGEDIREQPDGEHYVVPPVEAVQDFDITPGEMNVKNFGDGDGSAVTTYNPAMLTDFTGMEDKLIKQGEKPLSFRDLIDSDDPFGQVQQHVRKSPTGRTVRDNPQA